MSDSDNAGILARRIAERLAALGLSERKASLEATGQPDAIRFIRTRGTMPSATRLRKIAKTLQATTDYLTGASDINEWEKDRSFLTLAATIDEEANRQFESGRQVPVLGTIAFKGDGEDDRKGENFAIYRLNPEILTFAAAPLGWKRGRLGAFYPADNTMSPVFDPQVPAVFVHDQEAEIGDYALIFLKIEGRPGKTDEGCFVLRRVVDRGNDWITLEQLTPPEKRRLDAKLLSRTLKVLSLRDYVVPQIPR